ncbi:MAG: TRAP transporter large permease subunit [Rhodothermales bacterium]
MVNESEEKGEGEMRRLHPMTLAYRFLVSVPALVVVLLPVMRSPDANAWLSVTMLLLYGIFIVPLIVLPAQLLGIDLVWLGVLIGMNLQTSFLTPPFGFSLFYLRGVTPARIPTWTIYRGVVPFIVIQALVLAAMIVFTAPNFGPSPGSR